MHAQDLSHGLPPGWLFPPLALRGREQAPRSSAVLPALHASAEPTTALLPHIHWRAPSAEPAAQFPLPPRRPIETAGLGCATIVPPSPPLLRLPGIAYIRRLPTSPLPHL